LYVTVNNDEDGICEVFTHLGRMGGCPSQSEATARLISLAFRLGGTLDDVIDQLKGIRCHSCLKVNASKELDGLSCPDAIARALHAEEETLEAVITQALEESCPECGEDTVLESGCMVCKHCGFSKCG
jgi:ribonucleoside-diphosphate reductase alpha chain